MRGGFFLMPGIPRIDRTLTGIVPTVKVPRRQRPSPVKKTTGRQRQAKPKVTKKQVRDALRHLYIPPMPTYKPKTNHNPMMY